MRRLGVHLLLGFVLATTLVVGATGDVGPDEIIDLNVSVFDPQDTQPAIPMVAVDSIDILDSCTHCLLHRRQYRVVVPEGATALIVELANLSDPSGDIDLAVSVGVPITEDDLSIYAEYGSRGATGLERLTFSESGDGPITPGEYYIGVITLVGEGATFELRALVYAPTAVSTVLGDYESYCNATAGFSMDRPVSWEMMPAAELLTDEVVGFRSIATADGEQAVLKVTRSTVLTSGTVESGYEQIRQIMEAEPGYVFLDKSDVTIAGDDAIKYTFRRQYDVGPATVVVAYWISEGREWVVTFACTPVSAYDEHVGVLNRALSSLAYVSTCSGMSQTPSPSSDTEQPPVVATQNYGVLMGTIRDATGTPLGGVTVRLGTRTTATNDQGWFSLSDVPTGSRVHVTFSLEGYATTYQVAEVSGGVSTFIELVQSPVDTWTQFPSTSGATLTTPDGGAVTIRPATVVDGQGSTYSGTVDISVTDFDPTDEHEMLAFPGEYVGVTTAGTTVPIKSFGFMDISMRGSDGQELQLRNGETAALVVPVPTDMQAEAQAMGTCPMWYYDTTAGIWREEGHGTYDASRRAFVGTVTHLSTWNFDVSYPRAFISGRVITSTGIPVEGAAVRCWGKGWTYSRWESGETSTDSDGRFHRIPVECLVDVNYRALKGGHKSVVFKIGPLDCDVEYDVGDIVLDSPAVQAILSWGEDPSDLDSHLVGPSGLGMFHVYYSAKGSLADEPYANLDTDDTTSFGPEVVSISRVQPGTYRYSVRHYSGEGNIEQSGARVELVIPSIGIYRYTPPANQPLGTDVWRVVDLVVDSDGVLTVIPINDYVTGGDDSNLLNP